MWKKGSTNISLYTTENSDKNKFIVKLIAIAFLWTQGWIMHLFLQNSVCWGKWAIDFCLESVNTSWEPVNTAIIK